MYGNAAICVICLPNRTRQKKVGGCNICGRPRRHTYLARYMRGRGKKKGPKTTMSFRSASTRKVRLLAAKVGRVPAVVQKVARRIPSLDPIRLVVPPGGDKSDKT